MCSDEGGYDAPDERRSEALAFTRTSFMLRQGFDLTKMVAPNATPPDERQSKTLYLYDVDVPEWLKGSR